MRPEFIGLSDILSNPEIVRQSREAYEDIVTMPANNPEDSNGLTQQMWEAYGQDHPERLGMVIPFWWNGWQHYLTSLDSIISATDPLFERLEKAYEQGALDTIALSDEGLAKLGLKRIPSVHDQIETIKTAYDERRRQLGQQINEVRKNFNPEATE